MLTDGQITAGHARALLGLEDQAVQLALAEKVVKESLSVRQTEDLVRSYGKEGPHLKSRVKNSPEYKDLEKKMSAALGTRVTIKQKEKGKGRVEISYYSEDQLDEIFLVINKGK